MIAGLSTMLGVAGAGLVPQDLFLPQNPLSMARGVLQRGRAGDPSAQVARAAKGPHARKPMEVFSGKPS